MIQETSTWVICLLQTHSYFKPFCLNCDKALLEKIKGRFSPKSDFLRFLYLLIDISTQRDLNTTALNFCISMESALSDCIRVRFTFGSGSCPVLSKHKIKDVLYHLVSNNMP